MSNGTHELKFLDRKQISVLSEALKEAVQRSREFESKLSPAEIRRLIASSIVQQALDGEKDQTRLTEEALFEVQRTVRLHPPIRASLEPPRKPVG